MRVFMLGWEFPPHITGGLGTACYGLAKAMRRQPVQITFVLPRPVRPDPASPVRVLPGEVFVQPSTPPGAPASDAASAHVGLPITTQSVTPATADSPGEMNHVRFHRVPATVAGSYGPYGEGGPKPWSNARDRAQLGLDTASGATDFPRPMGVRGLEPHAAAGHRADDRTAGQPEPAGRTATGDDLIASAERYAQLCVSVARFEDFDVVHAHDWMTFPAGMAVAGATGKPLVVHVHSTEFDRAGDAVNQRIFEIERRGLHAAVRIIAVSHLTRTILVNRYDVSPDRVDVVYNGIDHPAVKWPDDPKPSAIQPADKIVLFLGRITMQKGPEYFIAAAKKVLEHSDKVKFVMAGAGDMVPEVMQLAAREGLAEKVLFTGFLSTADVQRVFELADVYVMPSVSEPFGIAALEAIRHDVPVIVSRTAGVSEVVKHTLKVDFWNVNDIADKILAVLRHAPLAEALRRNAEMEVRKLTWEDAARKVRKVYEGAVAAMAT